MYCVGDAHNWYYSSRVLRIAPNAKTRDDVALLNDLVFRQMRFHYNQPNLIVNFYVTIKFQIYIYLHTYTHTKHSILQ